MANEHKLALIKQGRRNTLKMLSLLEKYKYSTPSILGKLLDISRQGVYQLVKRSIAKNLVEAHHFNNGLGNRKIVGIKMDGLAMLASARLDKLPEDATDQEKNQAAKIRATRRFEISKFKDTQLRHTLTTQSVHVDLLNKLNNKYSLSEELEIKKIETASDVAYRLKQSKKTPSTSNQKFPDLILFTKDHGIIAGEIEIRLKRLYVTRKL